MNRRDSLKYIAAGTFASSFLLTGCEWAEEEKVTESLWKYKYGRTPKEMEHDNTILAQQFFTAAELALITNLGHFILPGNEFGDIEKAEVPEFIEFMAKDYPPFQTPLRDGLKTLNEKATTAFGKDFVALSNDEKKTLIDPIAYPNEADEALKDQVSFFTLMRNLVMTGYFTSEVGIKDLGYLGNQPNVWDGVPEDVLQEHGMAYDPAWESNFLNVEERNTKAEWDENGNLIT
jgi:hypothetical protein